MTKSFLPVFFLKPLKTYPLLSPLCFSDRIFPLVTAVVLSPFLLLPSPLDTEFLDFPLYFFLILLLFYFLPDSSFAISFFRIF